MDSYYPSVRSRFVLSQTHLPQTPSLEDLDVAEAVMMRNLASFVGDNPVPSPHYTTPTIASVQCLTSFHEKLLPSGRVDKIMAVGLGFAFAPDLLFTTHHLIAREDDPEYHLTSIHISEKINPSILLYPLEVVGYFRPLDVAVVQVRGVSLLRLSLQVSLPPSYTKIFTVKGIGSETLSIHPSRHYPSDRRFACFCDGISEEGFSGGPVLNSRGRVLGMFKGVLGTVDGLFITSEGLIQALSFIRKGWTFKDWGIKSVISDRPSRTPCVVRRSNAKEITWQKGQEEPAPSDDNPSNERKTHLFRKRAVEENAPKDESPPNERKTQYFRKRAAPDDEDNFELKGRKSVKRNKSTSSQKKLTPQSWDSTDLNKEKSWHPRKFFPAILTYKLT